MTHAGEDHERDGNGALTAAEYVLGVLTREEAGAVARAAHTDPSLAAEIGWWEANLARIADELSPVTPPAHAWRGIQAGIRGRAGKPAAAPKPTLWTNAAFWRGLSFGSLGLAAAAGIALFIALSRPEPTISLPERLVAALARAEGGASFVATYDPDRKQIVIVPAIVAKDPMRVPELWLVTRDKRVISLGVVDAEQPRAVVIPPHLIEQTSPGASLVITLEPPGGAPGGVATGPAIAKGDLSPI
jgi:anti-sigma-K factor RskA